MLGGVKQKVVTECLTLELMADELYVYRNDDVDIWGGLLLKWCYEKGICLIIPQNILPFSQYRVLKKDCLEARLELLSRVDEI